MSFLFYKVIFLISLTLNISSAVAQDWPKQLGDNWVKGDESNVSDHALFNHQKNQSIVLKTSKIPMGGIVLADMADDLLLEQAFRGKEFSDKVYGHHQIEKVSELIERSSGAIYLKRKESFKNDKNIEFFRINRVIIQNDNYYNVELIWPKDQNELVEKSAIEQFEKLNVL